MTDQGKQRLKRIAVFASHNGSDLQAIIDACQSGRIAAEVCVVISNNGDAKALERARDAGISARHISAKACGSLEEAEQRTLEILAYHQPDILFLAGYLKKLAPSILSRYDGRIFNIHPALLPKYGGQGMYGAHVHQAVIAAGEKESGISIHRVSDRYDEGEVVAQTRVAVEAGDTAETLAARILEREHVFIVEVLRDIVEGKIPTGPEALAD